MANDYIDVVVSSRIRKLEAANEVMEKALKDLRDHGTRHDPNPTQYIGNDLKQAAANAAYMQSMDDYVRRFAAGTLKEVDRIFHPRQEAQYHE